MAIELGRWLEVQSTFDTLIELDVREQRARLAALRSSDPELCAAVEALLAADADVDARLAPLEGASISDSIFGQDPFGLAGGTVSHFEVRETIGFGGMGVVYKAHDTRLGRDVALKFLLPSYNFDAAARARFLREAKAAAALDHPNICTVYDVGARDDGSLFMAMALYEGETLRARIIRESAIGIDEALEIARQIAAGLHAAHSAGVVHRDLKPGNIILLPNGSIRIFDFGLAKAREENFADTGSRFGTVSYMSPEQMRAENVDARADLWAFGVVFYEMLTGRKPFVGQDPMAVAQSILRNEPVPPSAHRPDIPEKLNDLVMQLLRKDPNERPQTAADVLHALSGVTTASNDEEQPRSRRSRLLPALAAAAVMMIFGLAAWWRWPSNAANDDRLLAVVPFRVAGDDRSLDYLREGIVDLLAVKLSGTTHVADPRSVLAAWQAAGGSDLHDIDRSAAMKLGAKFGAHDILFGTVTTAQHHVALRATLVPVQGGRSREVSLEAREDSILPLIDRLAVELLAFRAGEDTRGLHEIASVPFPAIREYLEGQRLARLGRYKLAFDRYRAATAADSDFAAAWFGEIDIGWWSGEGAGRMAPDTASRQLVRLRNRLTPAMRAMVDARIGLHYPLLPSLGERYRLAERAAQVAPDNPYAWQYLGDVLFHWGAAAGVQDAAPRAIAAFERTLALDSTLYTAIDHLPWLYYERGDTVSMRRWMAQTLAADSGDKSYLYLEDVLGNARSGAEWRAAIRDNFAPIEGLAFMAQDLALPLRPIDSVVTAFTARAVTDPERRWSTWTEAALAHVRGQPSREARLLGSIPGLLLDDWPTHVVVLESVLDDADSSLGAKARHAIEWGFNRDCARPFLCTWFTASLYDLLRGNPQTARTALARFHSPQRTECWAAAPTMCADYAMILEAMLAAQDKRPDAGARLTRLDSMLRDAPVNLGPLLQAGNLVAARLWEQSGDTARALAAVRRRVRLIGKPELYATYLREEGRLAAATGDREGARRAYRHYLTLRGDAEPSLQPQVAVVRRELARLERQN